MKRILALLALMGLLRSVNAGELLQNSTAASYFDNTGRMDADDSSLWNLPRFVDEVEQVRQALGLNRPNFFLLGHSWGGILAMEYDLKYRDHLKVLIISDMMASIPAYNDYARTNLMPAMKPEVLAEIQKLEAARDYAGYTETIAKTNPLDLTV